jgi:hypothetical protein
MRENSLTTLGILLPPEPKAFPLLKNILVYIAVWEENSPEIRKGIAFLICEGQRDDWTTDYPKGQGMAGFFYMHYHSYRYTWPLLSLRH